MKVYGENPGIRDGEEGHVDRDERIEGEIVAIYRMKNGKNEGENDGAMC